MEEKVSALTTKQERFCNEFLVDYNATQAAIRAGYSIKTAGSIGAENLTKPEIQSYLQERKEQMFSKLHISQERVLKEYARIAFADPRNFFDGTGELKPIDDLDDDEAAVLASVETQTEAIKVGQETIGTTTTKKVRFWDKMRALEGLGKHLGLFEKDNQQKIPDTSLLKVQIVPPKEDE